MKYRRGVKAMPDHKPVSFMFISCESVFESISLQRCSKASLAEFGCTAQQCSF
jgi:hypothetical protein